MAPTTSRLPKRVQNRQDAAWRAVQQFNTMLPTLSAFARIMTGNPKVTVKAGKYGSQTDGTNIWISPPIELGDDVKHDSTLCDYRDENKRRRCEACDVRENTLWSLYHEVAHITANSVAKPLPHQVKKIHELIDQYHPAEACSHAASKKVEASAAEGMLSLAGALTDFLPEIVRALEDARVDMGMVLARPGLRTLMEARAHSIFNTGIRKPDGTVKHWHESPFNAQVLIAVLLVAESIPVQQHYFTAEVHKVIADPALRAIALEAQLAQDVNGTLDITLKLWDRLQEMGLFITERCEPAPPSLPNKDQEQDDKSSDSGDGSDSGESGDDRYQLPDSKDEEQSTDSGSADSTNGDSSTSTDFENEDSTDAGGDKEDQHSNAESNDSEVSESDSIDPPEPDVSGESSNGDGEGSDGDGNTQEELAHGGDSEESDTEESDPETSNNSSQVSFPMGEDSANDSDAGKSDNDTSSNSSDGSFDRSPDQEDQDNSDGLSSSTDGPSNSDGESEDSESGLEEDAPEVMGADAWQDDDEQIDVNSLQTPEDSGDPAEVQHALQQFTGHHGLTHKYIESEEDSDVDEEVINTGLDRPDGQEKLAVEQKLDREAISKALVQALVFDTSSKNITGLSIIKYPHRPFRWYPKWGNYVPSAFMPPENIIGSSLLHARLVFNENARGNELRGLKSGRVDAARLGRRAPVQDPRIFKKKILPGKRDYFVVLGLDCSGSTEQHSRMELIKRSAFGMAELLARLGINFAVYSHTGGANEKNIHDWGDGTSDALWMLEIKSPTEPWNSETKKRLAELQPVADNFDGHSLEFYRKLLDSRSESDKIIMYYTDGAMPASNYDEELAVLQKEIAECAKRRYTNMAVGIRTDSPKYHGFDTVVVNHDSDLPLVISHLGKRLMQR